MGVRPSVLAGCKARDGSSRAAPRCIEDETEGACAGRPMHVVSTSMSRRDLNFPTLSAPYRTLGPLPRDRHRCSTLTPRCNRSSLSLSPLTTPSPCSRHGAARLHLPVRRARECRLATNTHVRAPNGRGDPRPCARATAHDFSPMHPGALVCVRGAFLWERKNSAAAVESDSLSSSSARLPARRRSRLVRSAPRKRTIRRGDINEEVITRGSVREALVRRGYFHVLGEEKGRKSACSVSAGSREFQVDGVGSFIGSLCSFPAACLFTNGSPRADRRYPIRDLVPILGQRAEPSFPRQFVTEKESVTVYLPIDRSISLDVARATGP